MTTTPLRSPLLQIRYTHCSERLELWGELDISTVALLDTVLERVLDGVGSVHIDLTRLEFADVTGMRMLAVAARRIREARRDLRLTGASPDLQRIAVLLGWPEAFSGNEAGPAALAA